MYLKNVERLFWVHCAQVVYSNHLQTAVERRQSNRMNEKAGSVGSATAEREGEVPGEAMPDRARLGGAKPQTATHWQRFFLFKYLWGLRLPRAITEAHFVLPQVPS